MGTGPGSRRNLEAAGAIAKISRITMSTAGSVLAQENIRRDSRFCHGSGAGLSRGLPPPLQAISLVASAERVSHNFGEDGWVYF